MNEVYGAFPRYSCHKQVWALKIGEIKINEDQSALIIPADKGYGKFVTRVNFALTYRPGENDLGYYVVYKDGYTSWSPTKAFEEGYTRI